jgi:hypothetical protein
MTIAFRDVVLGLSLIVSVIALWRTITIGGRQLRLQQAGVEHDIEKQVREARDRVEEFYLEHAAFLKIREDELPDEETKEKHRALRRVAEHRVEGYLNALNSACQKYLDDKVDRDAFAKDWRDNIRDAVRSPAHTTFLGLGHRFHCLQQVYEEFEKPSRRS